MIQQSTKTEQYSNRKKMYFRLFSLLFSIIILVVFELLLRILSYGNNLNLFIDHPHPKYKNFYLTNPNIGEKYFSTFDATGGTNDVFLKKKPDNGFRVIVMGSSTMVGFPYNRNLMSSRILEKRLQDAYPEKHIEVINTAITAINSITLNDFMGDIVKQDPDAILFYAGHNEFYGAFGIGSNETMSKNKQLRNLHLKFIKLRTYQLVRSIVHKTVSIIGRGTDLDNQKGSLMKKIVKDKDILYQDEQYNLGINQYRENLENILQIAEKEGIPVFIGDLVSNVKDIPPFGKNKKAQETYSSALQALDSGNVTKASELFYLAKDLDPVRFRASEEINSIIKNLSDEYNCFFIPVKEKFSEHSEERLIGNNLLTEHVHPNIDGQFLMADIFYDGIIQSQLISKNIDTSKSADYYRYNWKYTVLDSLIAEFRIKQLKSYWPFTSLEDNITFIETFSPQSRLDSLAFSAIIHSKIDEEIIHDSLARLYLADNNYTLALEQYEVLTAITPSWYQYLNQAANCDLKLNNLYAAQQYLNQSIKYTHTYFAHLMLGEIYSFKLDLKNSAYHYEKALSLSENKEEEEVALLSLHRVYTQLVDDSRRSTIEKQLRKKNITPPEQSIYLVFKYSEFVPNNIKSIMIKANEFKLNNADSALHYLSLARQINDCPLVNKHIGDQLYLLKDNRLLLYYDKAYEDYKYSSSFLVTYCIAKYVNKDLKGAHKVLTQLKQLDPSNTEISKLEKILASN